MQRLFSTFLLSLGLVIGLGACALGVENEALGDNQNIQFQSTGGDDTVGENPPVTTPPPPPVVTPPPGQLFSLSAPTQALQVNLMTSTSFEVALTGATDLPSPVSISVAATLQGAENVNNGITITPVPSSLTLAAGQTQTVQINVDVAPESLRFRSISDGGTGEIRVTGGTTASPNAQTASVPFGVNAVIEFVQAAQNGNAITWMPSNGTQVMFARQSGPLTINIKNNTGEGRVSHFTGLGTTHQNTGAPTPAGGTYTTTANTTQANAQGECYEHFLQNSGMGVRFRVATNDLAPAP